MCGQILRRLLVVSGLAFIVLASSAHDELPAPFLSHPHGLYSQPFTLALSCTEPSVDIFYTTDGSLPTSSSQRYEDPLAIESTTVVRAVASKGGVLSPVVTSSFLFVPSVLAQDNAPEGYPDSWGPFLTLAGSSPADYEMDPELTKDSAMAARIVEGMYQLPVVSLVTDKGNLFGKERDKQKGGLYVYTGASVGDGCGRGWERPVSFELFGGAAAYDLQSDCGLRIHGGHGRVPEKNPKHSFRLFWRAAYGDSLLSYPLYGMEGCRTFSTLILRAPFDNAWQHWEANQRRSAQYSRDMWMRTMQRRMGHPMSDGIWVHLFLNGLYWGMYTITERIDANYCAAHFGGTRADYDVIHVDERASKTVVCPTDGTMDSWNRLMALAAEAASSKDAFLRLQGMAPDGTPSDNLVPLLDVDNFMDYIILNQYAGNTDWDHHNWIAFCPRMSSGPGFRFVCWDSESVFGDMDENVVPPSRKHRGEVTRLFRYLVRNPMFLHRFIDRVYACCANDGLLSPDSVRAVWDGLYEGIDKALYAESARWGDYRRDVHPWQGTGELYTVGHPFMDERDRLLYDYFPQRTEAYLRQLRRKGWYPSVDAPSILVNGIDAHEWKAAHGDTLTVNDCITLEPSESVWYTLDGSDPVTWADGRKGIPSASSVLYEGQDLGRQLPAPAMPQRITVKAVSRSQSEWSPTHAVSFVIR